MINKPQRDMNKIIKIVMFSIVLLSIIVYLSNNFIWGFNSIKNKDELRHFARARQIYYHNININRYWDEKGVYNPYPSGLHILMAENMFFIDNTFIISVLLRIIFSAINVIIVFLIGLKINKRVAIFSSLTYIFFFEIVTNYPSYYTTFFTLQSTIRTYEVSSFCIFSAFLMLINSLEKKHLSKFHYKYFFIIYMVTTLHGLTHISTYIGFIIFMPLFVLIYLLINPRSYFRVLIMFLGVIILSTLSVYFLYYYNTDILINEKYTLGRYLPPFVTKGLLQQLPYILPIITALLLVLLHLINKKISYLTQQISNKKTIFHIKYLKKSTLMKIGIIVSFLLIYGIMAYNVTEKPTEYNYSTWCLLRGIFPLYIKLNTASFYTNVIYIYGFLLLALTVLGLSITLDNYNKKVLGIVLCFLTSYIGWFLFADYLKYYADRMNYFIYILPFIYGLGLYRVSSVKYGNSKKIKVLNLNNIIKKLLMLIFIFIFVSAYFIDAINNDPAVREEYNIIIPGRLGINNPQYVTYSLICVINHYTNKNEYILGSYVTVMALTATTHIRPPVVEWKNTYKDHSRWVLTRKALNGDDQSLKTFFNRYNNSRYFAIGVDDVYAGTSPGISTLPIDKYNKSHHLYLLYAKGLGERIYMYVQVIK